MMKFTIMKTNYLLPLIVIIFLVSCNNPKLSKAIDIKTQNSIELPYNIDLENNIDVDKSVPLSTMGKELEYIPLETTKSSMLTKINRIELSADFIFISDFNKLLQFDRKGKFIRQVGSNGRGPGEYIYVLDFCIDEKGKKVYVIAWGINDILEYDFVEKFIGKSSTLPFNSKQVFVNDSSGFVFHIWDAPDTTIASKNNLYITDPKFNILFKIKRHFIRNSNLGIGTTPMYFYNGSLRFEQFGVDTLYTVKKDKLEPYAIFNLGQIKMDPNVIFPRPGSLQEISDQLKDKLWINDVKENKNFLFIKLEYGLSDSSKNLIFNKQTSEIASLENNGFTNDIDGGIPFWPDYIYSDSILVDYYDANSFLNKIGKVDSEQQKVKYGDKYIQVEKLANILDKLANPVLTILHK
jgi:hypothetical protein